MILSNTDILQAIQKKRIIINPLPTPDQFSPSALDLRIGLQFLKWKNNQQGAELHFDLSTVNIPSYKDYIEQVKPESDGRIKLLGNNFILAITLEKIHLSYTSRLAARVEGRSSYARLGLQVHMTAPTVHCGFAGPIVLELKNCGKHPLMITPGTTCLCQLIFEEVKSQPKGIFQTTFLNQRDPLGRRKKK